VALFTPRVSFELIPTFLPTTSWETPIP
jgi:hypothetical protein